MYLQTLWLCYKRGPVAKVEVDAADAPMAALAGAAVASAKIAAAAGPLAAALGAAAGTVAGPSLGGQLPPSLTGDEAGVLGRWSLAKCSTLALEAEALELFAHQLYDADAGNPAIVARIACTLNLLVHAQ